MKICALRSFASLVPASLAVDHIAIAEGRQLNTAGTTRVAADTAATTEAKAAFVFGGVSYFQRWAQDDQCEFTPTGQENLEKWSDIIFTSSSVFQGIGNTLPPLFSSLTRLLLFAAPALIISQMPGFQIREVWYLSVGTVVLQMCVNLFLLRHELRKRLRFDEPENFIPASATAS